MADVKFPRLDKSQGPSLTITLSHHFTFPSQTPLTGDLSWWEWKSRIMFSFTTPSACQYQVLVWDSRTSELNSKTGQWWFLINNSVQLSDRVWMMFTAKLWQTWCSLHYQVITTLQCSENVEAWMLWSNVYILLPL